MKTKAKALDLGRRHGRSMRGGHLCEVFGKCINVLLEKKKGGTDGTQLSLINDKGEFLHGVGSASKLVLAGYWWMRRNEGDQSAGKCSPLIGLTATLP
jgi:hypothetical protein